MRGIDAPAAAATVGDSVDGGARCNFAAVKHLVERVNGTLVTLYNKALLIVLRTLFACGFFVLIHPRRARCRRWVRSHANVT